MILSFCNSRSISRVLGPACAGAAIVFAVACSQDDSMGGDGGSTIVDAGNIADGGVSEATTCADGGSGVTAGPADTHCQADDGGAIVQATSASSCHPGVIEAGGPGPMESQEAGMADGTCGNSDYGPTMYGSAGSDDDCKYDVTWEALSPICENVPVFFKVTAMVRSTQLPLTGADTIPEPVLACLVPAMGTPVQPTPEPMPGTYTVGPVIFQNAGVWDVRFHFNEDCDDTLPDSPHGHAAFWITVP